MDRDSFMSGLPGYLDAVERVAGEGSPIADGRNRRLESMSLRLRLRPIWETDQGGPQVFPATEDSHATEATLVDPQEG